jgi:hypothetical protein
LLIFTADGRESNFAGQGGGRDSRHAQLLKAGLADGSSDRLLAAAGSYDTDFGKCASQAAWGTQTNVVVTMPNGLWYPDGRASASS